MCDCFKTAEYFLRLQTGDAGDAISNMKLQKLLYYAQGFALAIFGKPLFNDDFEKWAYGPVLPVVYNKYKAFGSEAIPRPEGASLQDYTDDERKLLDEVYYTFGQYSAWALSEMSHATAPWRDAECEPTRLLSAFRDIFMARTMFVARRTRPGGILPNP